MTNYISSPTYKLLEIPSFFDIRDKRTYAYKGTATSGFVPPQVLPDNSTIPKLTLNSHPFKTSLQAAMKRAVANPAPNLYLTLDANTPSKEVIMKDETAQKKHPLEDDLTRRKRGLTKKK